MRVRKVEARGRSKGELDEVIHWLTGCDEDGLRRQIESGNELETFLAQAPAFNPDVALIQGLVCGVRVQDVGPPPMRTIRQLDKLVDELAKGKVMETTLRT